MGWVQPTLCWAEISNLVPAYLFTVQIRCMLIAMSDEYSQPTLELSRTFEGWWLPERALCCDDPFVAVSGA